MMACTVLTELVNLGRYFFPYWHGGLLLFELKSVSIIFSEKKSFHGQQQLNMLLSFCLMAA